MPTLPVIYAAGEPRKLGNIAPPAGLTRVWRVFGDVPQTPMIPRADWDKYLRMDLAADPWLPSVHDQADIGQCFPAGTLIRMADGSQKPIEEIRVLDEVLSAEGNVKRVTRTMVRRAAELLRVQTYGNRHLRCTAEHPILTKRGYVKADKLTREDWVAMPRYAPALKTSIMTADHLPAGRSYAPRSKTRGARVYTRSIPGKPEARYVVSEPPDVIQLTPEFGRLIGLFLAEGSTSYGKLTWGLSLKEADTLGAEILRLVAQVFGAEAKLRTNPANNVTIITLHGTLWARLFESWCASGSDGKRLHPDLASGPPEFLAAVLKGWTDGDGLGPGRNGGVTVSHKLAVGMFDIANLLGLRPTIETLDVKTYGQVKTRKRRYVVKWGQHPERQDYRTQQDDKYLWRKVDGVVREDFDGWVFNLEVEDDHSYVAEAIGVHNCNADATTAAMEAARAEQGLALVPLSAADLYDRINGGGDNGSTLEDGLHQALTVGVGTVASCGTLWRRGMRPAPAEERARYRVLQAFLCPTFDHCFSAVIAGFKLISGVLWYANYTPGLDGWLPAAQGSPVGGHAVMGYLPTKKGNLYGIGHQNSWTVLWGIAGRCVFPETMYRGDPIGGWWAVREVVDEGAGAPAPVGGFFG